jgi:hypothetical protein
MFKMTTLGLYTLLGTSVKLTISLELVLYKGRSIHNAAERCTLCFHVLLATKPFFVHHEGIWRSEGPFLTLCDFVITPCDQRDRLFQRMSDLLRLGLKSLPLFTDYRNVF